MNPFDEELIQKDYFGFLDYKHRIDLDGGYIAPIEDFDSIVHQVHEFKNINDNFIYPPVVWLIDEKGIKIPKSEKVDWKQSVPPSHEIYFAESDTRGNLRRGKAAFLIHLLGYLFGMRQQFYGWWFDGRLHIDRKHNIHFRDQTVSHFLKHSFNEWCTFTVDQKNLITNLLYMHGRSPIYQWDWERFAIEYMVFDGLYKLLCLRIGKNPLSEKHNKRIKFVCDRLGLIFEQNFVKEIVDLRNRLFHETLWSGSLPGTAVSGNAFYHAENIRRLNQRIIPALLGYKNKYVETHWWSIGSCQFDSI